MCFKHLNCEPVLVVMKVQVSGLIQSCSNSIKDGLRGISNAMNDVREIGNGFSYNEDFCKICLSSHVGS